MGIATAEQKCNRCGEMKPLSRFKRTKIGSLYPACRDCYFKREKELQLARRKRGDTKVCSHCGERKPLWRFNMGSVCHKCNKKRSTERYKLLLASNTSKTCVKCKQSLPMAKFQHDRDSCCSCVQDNEPGRVLYRTTKQNSVCVECGEKDWRVLEFAHFDAKTKYKNKHGTPVNICMMMTVKRIEEELKKGRFLCANCHRKETYKNADLQKYLAKRLGAVIFEEKVTRANCKDCLLPFCPNEYFVFEFDHLPGSKKLFAVSQGVTRKKTEEEVRTEMAKCDMVCANCHHVRTHERIQQRKVEQIWIYIRERRDFLASLLSVYKNKEETDRHMKDLDDILQSLSDLREFAQKKNIDLE